MIVYKAFPKVGKTAIMRELAYHIKETTDFNVGLIFLEETKKRIGLGLCSLYLNKPLQIPTTEYTMDELIEANEKVLGDDRFYIFDPASEKNAENVFEKIMHFIQAYECKYIFLDHISMLAYDSIDGDERKFLDKLLKDLKDLTTAHDIHLAVVTHVNDDGKTRGSRASYQLCDALIHLDRDKLNPDKIKANTTTLTVEENRISGESGIACSLFYDRDTGRLVEIDPDFITQGTAEKETMFDD
jgi:twinkle protein